MKHIVLFLCIFLAGCTELTEYGECNGLLTEDEQSPQLTYHINKWNVFLGIIFLETIIVPFWVTAFALKCPVAVK